MKYCSYHPLMSATYTCASCATDTCDTCTHREAANHERCFVCNGAMESLGSAYSAPPFWRRLEKSFRYPVNTSALAMIFGSSILTLVASHLPFGFIFVLLITGGFIKYSFACLERSAYGDFKPAPIDEGFGGGLSILLQLFGMFIVIGAVLGLVYRVFGYSASAFCSVIAIAGLPAMLINFALSKSFFEALNPLAMLKLIHAIGLPYGLLLSFIMIMFSSVAVINGLFPEEWSPVAAILESSISNYYMIVMFHIMGYMIFQYQDRLGFSAREDYGDDDSERSDVDILAAKINVWIKEGGAEQVLELFNTAIEKYPEERQFYEKCFTFLIETKTHDRLFRFLPLYLDYLTRVKDYTALYHTFKRVQTLIKPNYLPEDPAQRYHIAKLSFQRGNYTLVLALLNGMHKHHPKFADLADAYHILAESLAALPQYRDKADACRLLAKKLAKRTAPRVQRVTSTPAASTPVTPRPSTPLTKDEKNTKPNEDSNGELPPIDFPGFSS